MIGSASHRDHNQKCKILLTNVSKMDNEPGHKRKVFVLKVKTGSNLIPDEEVKPCAPFLPPCTPVPPSRGLFLKGCWAEAPQRSAQLGLLRNLALREGCQCSAAGGPHKAPGIRKTGDFKPLLLPPCRKHLTERAQRQLRHPSFHSGESRSSGDEGLS